MPPLWCEATTTSRGAQELLRLNRVTEVLDARGWREQPLRPQTCQFAILPCLLPQARLVGVVRGIGDARIVFLQKHRSFRLDCGRQRAMIGSPLRRKQTRIHGLPG